MGIQIRLSCGSKVELGLWVGDEVRCFRFVNFGGFWVCDNWIKLNFKLPVESFGG